MSGLCGSSDDDRRRCDGHPPQAPGPTEAPVAPTTAPEPTAAPVTVPDTTGVAAGQCARDPQVITDTVFEDENWLHNFVVNTPEGEPWVILDGLIGQDRWGERRLDTGRPDPSRWVWYAWDGDNAPAYALISHRYIGEEVTGPVDSLKFAYDAWANSVNVAPLLIQGETCYAADGLFVTRPDAWLSNVSESGTAADFARVSETRPVKPDFSQPMSFGFATSSTTTRTNQRDMRISATENWVVEIWS